MFVSSHYIGGFIMSQNSLKPAHLRQFTTLKLDFYGNVNTEEGYDRAVEPVPKMLEQIADPLGGGL